MSYARTDPLQRRRAGADRDADEPAGAGGRANPCAPAGLQPLTGDFGSPEDVAGAIVYLTTAPFVTGTVLTVDGGWTAK